MWSEEKQNNYNQDEQLKQSINLPYNTITNPRCPNQLLHHHPSYPISTIMNQVSSQNLTTTALNSIRSSIPINLKPPPLSSFVKLPYAAKQQSVLAPSHKRSAPAPIKLSPSPVISPSDFDSYLQQVQAEFDRWKSHSDFNPQLIDSNSPSESLPNPTHHSQLNSASTAQLSQALPSLSAIPNVFFDRNFSLNDPLTFDLLTQRQHQPSSSDNHPSEPGLNSAPLHTNKPSASIADLTTDHISLDKLSHYLDLVQLHLEREIRLRSPSFFSALGNLQSLHAQTSQSVAQIEALKHQLDQIKQTVADKALDIIRYGIRRRNITNIELALTKINHVSQTILAIEQLIQSGEWHSALGLIEDLEQLWHSSTLISSEPGRQSTASDRSSPSASVPQVKFRLSKLKALAALPKRLSLLKSTISRALEAELSSILSHDLKINLAEFANAHLPDPARSHESSSPTSIHSLSSNLPPSQAGDRTKSIAKERIKERIRSTFHGLTRADGMDKALGAWRESVVKQIRNIVKDGISDMIEGDLDDKDDESDISQFTSKDKRNTLSEKTVTLTRNLKALKHAEFLKISEDTFRNLLGCIELVDTHSQALLELVRELNAQAIHPADSDLATDLPSVPSSTKPSDEKSIGEIDALKAPWAIDVDTLSLKLNEIVQTSAELANARFAKVIGVRTEVHAQLSFAEFFAIFDSSWRFVIQCEVISRRMIIALRGVMVSQAKAFLQNFHQNKITESAKIVEQEQWTPVDVPSQIQRIVDLIVSSAMEDPVSLVITRKSSNMGNQTNSVDSNQSSKLLEIEGTFYHAVSAALETLKTIADYLRVVVNCSLLTTDLMGKIIEFLKAFNSRICQVVLGAGAIRSAGLKNITAKHLALASQALSTMISLIPYIRECMRRHLNMKQAVMLVDFDKLKRDYQEHQNEVHSKLVSIMADRLAVHRQTLQSIDWENVDEPPSDQVISPSSYLESLFKEVGTLHRVLGRYLSSSTLQCIMSQVFSAVNTALLEEFTQIEIQSTHGRNKLLRDTQYLSSKLIELNASEECQSDAKALEDLVQKRFSPKELTTSITSPENKNPSAPEISSPISPLAERAESFRSKFRFLSPGRKLSFASLSGVAESATHSSPGEEKVPTPTSPAGSFAEAAGPGKPASQAQHNGLGAADDNNGSTADQVQAIQEVQVNSKRPAEDASLDLIAHPQKETTLRDTEPMSLTSLDENASPAPLPSRAEDVPAVPFVSLSPQPPKLTLSQRLAALASSRRGSQTLSSSSSPHVSHAISEPDLTNAQSHEKASTKTPPAPAIEEVETSASRPQDEHHEKNEENTLTKSQTATRLSFKERLAAIAAKAASNPSPRQAAHQQHPPELQNSRGEEGQRLENNLDTDACKESQSNPKSILDKESQKEQKVSSLKIFLHEARLPSQEEIKLLPALPCSPNNLATDEEQASSIFAVKSAEIQEGMERDVEKDVDDPKHEIAKEQDENNDANQFQSMMSSEKNGRDGADQAVLKDSEEDEAAEELIVEGVGAKDCTDENKEELLQIGQKVNHHEQQSNEGSLHDRTDAGDKEASQNGHEHPSNFELVGGENSLSIKEESI